MDKKPEFNFTVDIKKVPDMDAAYIEFPHDIKILFNKGRLKVNAEFDGEPYQGSIVNMGVKNNDGSICYIIGINKAIRKKINKTFGDHVSVRITERDN